MDKYDKHLEFLVIATQLPESQCQSVFQEVKRDVRYALHELLKPTLSKENLMERVQMAGTESEKLENLQQWWLHFMPNIRSKYIVGELEMYRLYRLDTYTIQQLKTFRRPPTKTEIDTLFNTITPSQNALFIELLHGLTPFGFEIQHQLNYIQNCTQSSNLDIAKAALQLLGFIPDGIQKSLMLLWSHLPNLDLRFEVLKTMLKGQSLGLNFLYTMFQPIIQEYERLRRSEGEINALWEEFCMIRTIFKKNGGEGRIILTDGRIIT